MLKLSRSKIDLFVECPRCFYLDKMLDITRPSGPSFSLNSAVDVLLKNEFDLLRKEKKPHELMNLYKIDAVPYAHTDLEKWRNNRIGIQYPHEETGLLVYGAIDDVWVNPKGELHIVDYKSTSTKEEINLNSEWKQGYKRQAEIYQWLFEMNGFAVSKDAYFVFANATKARDKFDARLEFEMSIIRHRGSTAWVGNILKDIAGCLNKPRIPEPSPGCKFCEYFAQRTGEKVENMVYKAKHGGHEEWADCVEKSPAYLKVAEEVDRQADEELENTGLKGALGACHAFWGAKQDILKKEYGIKWRTPPELNSNIHYD